MRRLLATLVLLVVVAPAAASYDVTVRRSAHGIPHITAKDFGSLAYGYARAFAYDNICVIADSYVTVNAERSRFFGPDKTYPFRGNGTAPNNLNSDFFYARINKEQVVEKLVAQKPPAGPSDEIREGVRGYVAGYNAYLRETRVERLHDPSCRGEAWVRPITEIDVYRRFYQLALLASSGVAIDGIGGAQPPVDTRRASAARALDPREIPPGRFDELLGGIGSNAYGFGDAGTGGKGGLLLGNPHFPWDGGERFYQAHLTIPGKVDVSGGSLFGVPLVLIGHTKGMAWSHTVSTARRFTPFELELVPGDPTAYVVDGQPRKMHATTVTVQALGAGGELEDRTRTLYASHHGPILTSILGLPIFPWTTERAYAMGDANAANFRYLNHFFETNRAQTVDELDAILKRYLGIPWVNTIAADSRGKAYYADIGSIPGVPDAKIAACSVPLGVALNQAQRLQVLDGSRSACEWDSDPEAIAPGILGPKSLPSLRRDDYVSNMNDSYWLTNPRQPIEGYSRVIGDERTARSLRTRLGLRIAEDELARGGFTRQELQDAVFNNRQYAGELFRDELVAMCRTTTGVPPDACDALAGWDLRDDLGSKGALLFRRFATRALAVPGGPYRVPFSVEDPVDTPRGLNTSHPLVRKALVDAVADLRGASIPFAAPLGDFQYELRGDERIPIHGGPGGVGVFNAINVVWDPERGYPNVPHGSSYVQVVALDGSACPDARTILTYSQSTNRESHYFGDQTRLFSAKRWVKPPFCAADVERGAQRTTLVGEGRRVLAGYELEYRRGAPSMRLRLTTRDRATVTVQLMRGARTVRTVRRRVDRSRSMTIGVPKGRTTLRVVARRGSRTDVSRVALRR